MTFKSKIITILIVLLVISSGVAVVSLIDQQSLQKELDTALNKEKQSQSQLSEEKKQLQDTEKKLEDSQNQTTNYTTSTNDFNNAWQLYLDYNKTGANADAFHGGGSPFTLTSYSFEEVYNRFNSIYDQFISESDSNMNKILDNPKGGGSYVQEKIINSFYDNLENEFWIIQSNNEQNIQDRNNWFVDNNYPYNDKSKMKVKNVFMIGNTNIDLVYSIDNYPVDGQDGKLLLLVISDTDNKYDYIMVSHSADKFANQRQMAIDMTNQIFDANFFDVRMWDVN